MESKACRKCKVIKETSQFPLDKRGRNGLSWRCRACLAIYSKQIYEKRKLNPIWVEAQKDASRKRAKEYRKEAKVRKNKQSNKNYKLLYSEKYPEKIRAQSVMSYLLKKISVKGSIWHHWSYNEEHLKDVILLTINEHAKAHRFLIYDQERYMFRRYDTNELLDNKSRHEEFIRWCIKTKED